MIDEDEKVDVQLAMIEFGGSFVSALGLALSHADQINTQKIHDAFPEYWEQYKKVSKMKKGD